MRGKLFPRFTSVFTQAFMAFKMNTHGLYERIDAVQTPTCLIVIAGIELDADHSGIQGEFRTRDEVVSKR